MPELRAGVHRVGESTAQWLGPLGQLPQMPGPAPRPHPTEMITPTVCAEPGCPEVAERYGRCPTHALVERRRRHESTRAWRARAESPHSSTTSAQRVTGNRHGRTRCAGRTPRPLASGCRCRVREPLGGSLFHGSVQGPCSAWSFLGAVRAWAGMWAGVSRSEAGCGMVLSEAVAATSRR
jgi:hypothetical protein